MSTLAAAIASVYGRSGVPGPDGIPGLVGWWKQGDWASAAERVSAWTDSSGITFEPYVPYGGVTGQYASAPDNAAFDITGDISIAVRVAMDDWSPGAVNTLVGKYISGTSQVSYLLYVNLTTGVIRLVTSPDGTNAAELTGSSTAAPTVSNADYLWVMVSFDVDNGGGNRVYKFYTAPDSATIPTAWTQLGTTVTTAGATSIFNSTTALTIGGYGVGGASSPLSGRVKRALVYSGIVAADGTGGTMVADYNPSIQSDGAVSWTSASPTGEVWTQNGGTAVRSTKALRQLTAASQPIELPWTGTNYAWLPGVASNTITAPTKSLTGNLTITLDLAAFDWTPGTTTILCSKVSGNNGFTVSVVATTGVIRFIVGDGASSTNVDVVAAPGWTDNTRHELKIVWQDGVGATFFYDGVQSGAQVAAAKTLTDSGTALTFGPVATIAAKWYDASITNSASTTYYSVDFTAVAEGTASFAQNGDTYTVNVSGAKQAQIVGSPQLVGDGAAYFMRASYTQAQPCTRYFLVRFPTWTSGRYMTDGAAAANTAAMTATTSTPRRSMNAGSSANETTAATLLATHVVAMVWNGATSSFVVDTTTVSGGNPGTATTGGLTIMSDGAAVPSLFAGGQFKEILEYNAAHTPAQVTQVLRYLNRIGNLGLSL